MKCVTTKTMKTGTRSLTLSLTPRRFMTMRTPIARTSTTTFTSCASNGCANPGTVNSVQPAADQRASAPEAIEVAIVST